MLPLIPKIWYPDQMVKCEKNTALYTHSILFMKTIEYHMVLVTQFDKTSLREKVLISALHKGCVSTSFSYKVLFGPELSKDFNFCIHIFCKRPVVSILTYFVEEWVVFPGWIVLSTVEAISFTKYKVFVCSIILKYKVFICTHHIIIRQSSCVTICINNSLIHINHANAHLRMTTFLHILLI